LRGKKVNFWKRESITSLAADTIFNALGIDVEPVYLDNAAAIEKLRNGEIDGVARMSGAPHNDYNTVKPEDGFHLLPLDTAELSDAQNVKLTSVYLPAELTSKQYPQLIPAGKSVPTMATIIVLAVYNWPEKSERYVKLEKFVQRFFGSIADFRNPARHPKWTSVNLAANVSGWQRFKPAQDWLDQNVQASQNSGWGLRPKRAALPRSPRCRRARQSAEACRSCRGCWDWRPCCTAWQQWSPSCGMCEGGAARTRKKKEEKKKEKKKADHTFGSPAPEHHPAWPPLPLPVPHLQEAPQAERQSRQ
jgi:hypothetical protein